MLCQQLQWLVLEFAFGDEFVLGDEVAFHAGIGELVGHGGVRFGFRCCSQNIANSVSVG